MRGPGLQFRWLLEGEQRAPNPLFRPKFSLDSEEGGWCDAAETEAVCHGWEAFRLPRLQQFQYVGSTS